MASRAIIFGIDSEKGFDGNGDKTLCMGINVSASLNMQQMTITETVNYQ